MLHNQHPLKVVLRDKFEEITGFLSLKWKKEEEEEDCILVQITINLELSCV